MFKTIDELNPSETEREIAAAQSVVAADLDAGAFLVRITPPGQQPRTLHILFLPAMPWPGGTLAELLNDTGYYYRQFFLTDDLAEAMTAAAQKLAIWQAMA